MNHPTGDTGAQYTLDNRKLIVGFALLIVLCGTFFVIGFMEGKRQGIQRSKELLTANAVTPPAPNQVADSGERAPDQGAKPVPEKSVREQLEWYKSVNKREEVPANAAPKPAKTAEVPEKSNEAKSPVPQTQAAKKPAAHSSPATSTQKTTYTVQVGAFKHRREAETKAAALKAGGYEYFIEPSGAAEPLFLLKVGRYSSRAEAVATHLKLKKDGFATFIKTNP